MLVSMAVAIWAILGGKWTDEWSFHNHPYSLDLCLPPLGVLILKLDRKKTAEAMQS